MSDKDNHPTRGDSARPVYPVTFEGQEHEANSVDWRPRILPADAEEEMAPKVSSAPEPASSPALKPTTEAKAPASPAPKPAAKASGPGKVSSPGTPGS